MPLKEAVLLKAVQIKVSTSRFLKTALPLQQDAKLEMIKIHDLTLWFPISNVEFEYQYAGNDNQLNQALQHYAVKVRHTPVLICQIY